jgi:hypothetical protein
MLPLLRFQLQVYRLGEKHPPVGTMADHAPHWAITSLVLEPLDSRQIRMNLQPDFHWLATLGSATVNTQGGYRAQIYDTRKALRFADRGVNVAVLGGDTHGVNWFRDPYVFDVPNPQVLLIVQNLENATNDIQLALYGQVLRFNQDAGTP